MKRRFMLASTGERQTISVPRRYERLLGHAALIEVIAKFGSEIHRQPNSSIADIVPPIAEKHFAALEDELNSLVQAEEPTASVVLDRQIVPSMDKDTVVHSGEGFYELVERGGHPPAEEDFPDETELQKEDELE